MRTLLNFSGGIDSTYCLYHHLKDNPKETLLVHHLNLINREGRAPYEKQAVTNILNWCIRNGMGNFKYIESTFDYGTLGYLVKDLEVIGFLTGVILRHPGHQKITDVILPMHKSEMARFPGDSYQRAHHKRKVLAETVAMREVNFTFPIIDMTKKQIIEGLPEELFKMTWYCRRPRKGEPCGKCHTCLQVKEAL